MQNSPLPVKEQKDTWLDRLCLVYLTWFGVGYVPRAPGTFGTIAALPMLWFLQSLAVPFTPQVLLVFLMTLAACAAAERVQTRRGLQDPQWIIIDEVIGMFITTLIVAPRSLLEWALAFGAFRFFDIVKLWPASYFDREVKNGAGTILDDVVSGFMAGLFVYGVAHFFLR
jgi:phosphatidylglycerophosphatase A